MRAYIIVAAILIAIFGSIGGYLFLKFSRLASMDFSPPPVTVAAADAVEETWGRKLSAVGTIKAVRGVDLTSETSGEITDILFESGTLLEKGQLLVVLNDEVEKASKRNQIAALDLAEVLFERDSRLIEQKSIPQSQYDQSRADFERAKAQLAETEARLANKRIEAPFTGTVGIRQVDVGDYLEPGDKIAALQDHSELEIDFTIPSRYAPQLKAGLNVDVVVDAFPGLTFTAVVTAVDARIDTGTRNVLVRSKLLSSDGLLPGMFASLELDLGDDQSVVTIPETAMTYSIQGNTVFVIEETEDGGLTANARVVDAGSVRDGRVAVTSGLAPGERVVSVGQNKLYRGVRLLIDETVTL